MPLRLTPLFSNLCRIVFTGAVAAALLAGTSLAWGQTASAPAAASAAPQANAAAVLQDIAKQLTANTPAVLRGQFEQRKSVAGFKNPLVSQGRFVVARERGLLWSTDTPFASQLLIKPNQLISFNGAAKEVLDATREPGLRAFNQLIIALLAGDVSALQSQFDVVQASTATPSQPRWTLRLRPKEAGMARFIQEISLEGQDFVEQVQLQEGSGDSSLIRFSAQQPSTLTAEEQALL